MEELVAWIVAKKLDPTQEQIAELRKNPEPFIDFLLSYIGIWHLGYVQSTGKMLILNADSGDESVDHSIAKRVINELRVKNTEVTS